jgi:hypothetical protein
VRPERIALVDEDRLRSEPLVDPIGEEQVRGHVVVDQANAKDPDAPGSDERDRRKQGGEGGSRNGTEGGPSTEAPQQDCEDAG